MDPIQIDEPLRRLCGWNCAKAVPHQSKFSRALAEFTATQLPQQLHEANVAATKSTRWVGCIARNSTAIGAREHFASAAWTKVMNLDRYDLAWG
ncbi:MAG: hypothetical protein ABI693_12060 [Bryobacteraceae bacterium]